MAEPRSLRLDSSSPSGGWSSQRPSSILYRSVPPPNQRMSSSAAQYMPRPLGNRLPSLTTATSSRLDELRLRIYSSHLSYLNMEDTAEKVEAKSKLEVLIFDYLSIVPHSQKFSVVEVASCFNQTIMEKGPDYSANDASTAFERLEQYASNILRHPWRREYRTILTFGGGYRHYVHNKLLGAEKVLQSMGYREKKGEGVPTGTYQMEEVLDPDKLSKVALDCLVAFVESNIIHQIFETLNNPTNSTKKVHPVTYDDVFSARVRTIGGMDHTIKILTTGHDDPPSGNSSPRVISSSGRSSNILRDASLVKLASPSTNFDLISNHGYNPYHHRHQQTVPSPSYTSKNSQTFILPSPTHPSQPVITEHIVNNPLPPPAMFANDGPKPLINGAHESRILPRQTQDMLDAMSRATIHRSESEASSLKFGGLRGPSPPAVPPPPAIYDRYHVYPEPYHREEHLFGSSNGSMTSRQALNNFNNARDRTSSIESYRHRQSAPPPPPLPLKSSSLGSWSCPTCTYKNRASSDVCEMCSRSKERRGESSPLVSGGRECTLCTLVNDREATHCKACSADLFDSPTYI